jgi:hypothetical protein
MITFEQIKHIWDAVIRPNNNGTYVSEKKQINGVNWCFIWHRPVDGTETIKFFMRDETQHRITIDVVDNNLETPQCQNIVSDDSTNYEINFLAILQKQCWEDETKIW